MFHRKRARLQKQTFLESLEIFKKQRRLEKMWKCFWDDQIFIFDVGVAEWRRFRIFCKGDGSFVKKWPHIHKRLEDNYSESEDNSVKVWTFSKSELFPTIIII